LPRKKDIEAAIAAYNSIDRRTLPLPPDVVRLLSAMFPRDIVCQRSLGSLAAEGFDKRTLLPRMLRALIDAGFLSKEPGQRGVISTYRLHLPPVRP